MSSERVEPAAPAIIENDNDNDRRACWVCFATDEDDYSAKWVRPCRCRGTTKWVHNSCIQRWCDEKQQGNPTVVVYCPQCNTQYVITYPALSPELVALDYGDRLVNKVAPIATAGIVVGSLYWSAVTFGAVSVMQVMGHKQGLEVMERSDPLFLLVGLPTIPFGLVLGKMIRWEDYLLQIWRTYSSKFWLLRKLFGSEGSAHAKRTPVETSQSLDFISTSRLLVGALMLPTMATICGNYLFKRVESPFKRTLMGGAFFVGVKGVIKMYFKQQQYIRLSSREVEDFLEPTSL